MSTCPRSASSRATRRTSSLRTRGGTGHAAARAAGVSDGGDRVVGPYVGRGAGAERGGAVREECPLSGGDPVMQRPPGWRTPGGSLVAQDPSLASEPGGDPLGGKFYAGVVQRLSQPLGSHYRGALTQPQPLRAVRRVRTGGCGGS